MNQIQSEGSLTDALESRIRELQRDKEELIKQFQPFLDAEFARNLCEWREGEMETAIAEDFRKVVAAVKATGKKGKISIAFTVVPGKGSEVKIDMDCKTSVPKWGVDSAIAFADEDGALHRSDPAQMEMFERKEIKRNA